ncbi:MgtC/SapB family protein [Salinisphaera sp. USBA-960]|uniref:MgtC/SapB family protein n=1 Tax=Salinisphaera orenii TaxID=856731 RepID=UPI000DBE03E9|nr:MgtC/SapB family protein [Salifodinibacter halophilus]NNC26734.1 MgtC/SapB family protein [Salifodinibacter halophilus]
MDIANSLEIYRNLAVAFAIGLLIGLERGWQQREAEAGERVAGLRTFAVIGLAGGVLGLLSARTDSIVLGFGFVALAVILVAAHFLAAQSDNRYGITSELAAFATFGLAALAATGAPYVAAAGGVVMAMLLGLKPELHRWLQRLDRDELIAGLQLLMISVVVLPVLPDRALGPWQALNPYRIWLLVVVVGAISFAGHFAVRVLGHRRGILLTGIFGGLASSTALTLHFARLSKRTVGLDGVLGAGIVIAQAVSIPRIVVITLFVTPALVRAASVPLGVMTAVAIMIALLVQWRSAHKSVRAPRRMGPPFQLSETLKFALLVVVITLASAAAEHLLGVWSINLVAIVAGAANLTAATLSIAGLAQNTLPTEVAVRALVIAAASGVMFKGLVAYSLGGRRLGIIVVLSAAGVAATGVLIACAMLIFAG